MTDMGAAVAVMTPEERAKLRRARTLRTEREKSAFWARLVDCWLAHPLDCPCKGT